MLLSVDCSWTRRREQEEEEQLTRSALCRLVKCHHDGQILRIKNPLLMRDVPLGNTYVRAGQLLYDTYLYDDMIHGNVLNLVHIRRPPALAATYRVSYYNFFT